jgi:hypothetical protein
LIKGNFNILKGGYVKENYFKERKPPPFIFVVIYIIILLFCVSCGDMKERQNFKADVIERLPEIWKDFAVDAVENFLNQNSNRYDKPFIEVIEEISPELAKNYYLIIRAWETYQISSDSESHNRLVKKMLELKIFQSEEVKALESHLEETFKNITEEDLGITEEVRDFFEKVKEEKYEISLQLLNRKKYDNYWFTVKKSLTMITIFRYQW